jgi:hypothetical protein
MKIYTPLIIALPLALLLSGCSKHRTLASSESFTVEAGASIGPVHSGMTMQQVTDVLGEPSRTLKGVLEYQKLGLVILPEKEGLVGIVMCVSHGGGGEVIHSFAGHTKEGIGIGASKAEVIKAYGTPPDIESHTNYEHLIYYKTHGINFVIKNDKVDEISVFLHHDA